MICPHLFHVNTNTSTQTLKRQNRAASNASFTSLLTYLHASSEDLSDVEKRQDCTHTTDEGTLCISLERLFKLGVPRQRFKVRCLILASYPGMTFDLPHLVIILTQGFNAAGTLSMTADTDAGDEFEFFDQKSSAFADEQDYSQDPDLPLLWDDWPISSASSFLAQRDCDSLIPNEHHMDEYFLDNESDWTQDGEGAWVWHALEHDTHFGFGEEDDFHVPDTSSDLEEFSLNSPHDLILAPLRTQHSPPPGLPNAHPLRSSQFPGADSHSNWHSQSKSQDGSGLLPLNGSARSSTLMPDCLSPLVLPSNKEVHPSIRSSYYTLSGPAYLEKSASCDKRSHSGSDSGSEVIIYDFDNEFATLSDPPVTSLGDGMHNREPDNNHISESCTSDNDVEARNFSCKWDEEEGLIEFGMD